MRRALLIALATAACPVTRADAQDPTRALSQYIRDLWGPEQGFPGGAVYAIDQTADGYLWIGTEKGLVRFDGVTFLQVPFAVQPSNAVSPILGLMADGAGKLWVRPPGIGVFRYDAGHFQRIVPDHFESYVSAMSRSRRADILLWALDRGTVAYRDGQLTTLVSNQSLPGSFVISMMEAADGTVWLGTRDAGLFYARDGRVVPVTAGLPDRKVNTLLPLDAQNVLIGTDNGIVLWNGTALTMEGLPPVLAHMQVLAMTRDRASNIWIGAASYGLLRLNAAGVSTREAHPDKSRAGVTALFEDREGSLWAGSEHGLERLRDSVFMTYTAAEGMPGERGGPVYVDADDRAWFAPVDGGLYWRRGGVVQHVTVAGLDKDVIYSLTGSDGDLWIGRQRGGLTRLRTRAGSAASESAGLQPFTAETFTEKDGLAQNNVYAVHKSRDGAVWAGTLSGGVSRFKDGRFTTYTIANGLAANTVSAMLETADGTMWFATPNGLSALANGRWRTYTIQDGLPSDTVDCLFEDDTHALWIGTAEGLAVFTAGSVRVPRDRPAALREQIVGLSEDASHALWITTASHVLRVTRDPLLAGSVGEQDIREFGVADGLRSREGVKRHRSVVRDRRGRIWFSMTHGLSVVDPARLTRASAPALVHVQGLSADGRPVALDRETVRIPSTRQRVIFNYVGLSLAVPERVRFRYRLDGFDRDWSQPVASREAIYTNLAPGAYYFRVIASNSDGLWNGAEAGLRFEIEPAFWQTSWFRASILLVGGLGIWTLFRIRIHRMTRQLNVRFEERLAERTRIAQELHDTLLQGFVSASMQLHVAADQLPDDAPAKTSLGRVLTLMAQVIEEGRNAVRGLRSSTDRSNNLEQAFSRIPHELGIATPVDYRVIVEGRPRPLHPVIRDEVYRIGREALVNAFRHAGATSIEVQLEYAAHHLRMLVRDDGCGIDPLVLRSGRDGHWGLSGMRERADRIGAPLKVWSRASAGTEVELTVPRHIAFHGSGT